MNKMPKTILLVEDDVRLSELVKGYLEKQAYAVQVEYRGDRAIDRIIQEQPDMVILDLMLPGRDGLSVCRDVRSGYQGPILILTAQEDNMDQVAGLELGADDYVKKPVEPRVLLARIRALFRRVDTRQDNTPSHHDETLTFGLLSISKSAREVHVAGNPIDLSTSDFDLLWFLASHAGTVLERDRIYREIKGIEYDGLDRAIDVAVSRLRKKLSDNAERPFRIKTVWGSGYLFAANAWD